MSVYNFRSTSLTSKHIILVLHVGMKIQALVVKYEPFMIQMHLINSTNTGECIVKIQHPSYKKYNSQKISRMQSAKKLCIQKKKKKKPFQFHGCKGNLPSGTFILCHNFYLSVLYVPMDRQIYTCLYIQSALNLTMKHCDTVIVR